MKRTLVPFLLLLLVTSATFAQGYRGRDFWICFPQNAVIEDHHILSLSLFITAETRATGTIENMTDSSVQHFSVEGGSEVTVGIDTLIEMRSSGQIERKSLHIVSDRDIMVYVVSHRMASTDSYAAIPTPGLGTNYIEAGYPMLHNGPEAFTSQAAIVATEDRTLVKIHLTSDTRNGMPKGRTVEIALNRGQTFQLQGYPSISRNDLTGTEYTSTKPIAFFAGHECAQVPPSVEFCDMLLEEEPPMRDWGKNFILTKFEGKDFSVARIIASEDSTEVSIDGSPVALLSRDSFYTVDTLRGDATIESSEPVLVAQYGTSSNADAVKVGDPFMLFVIPNDRFIGEVTTTSLESNVFNNYLNIVIPRAAERGLRIDGLPFLAKANAVSILDTHERSAPGGKYAIISVQLRDGRHLVQSPEPFAAYSYGFGTSAHGFDSYGHACGMRLEVGQ